MNTVINKNDATENKIDIVMMWLDNNDIEWQKDMYAHRYGHVADFESARFRDWDNLKYWFRSIEMNAPWVRKIHFVTCGHLPKWLNTSHPKLNLVSHKDYIDAKYLPTFSASAIELGLHRIEGICEQFILFNDDMFLINPTQETDFFYNGLPCDAFILNAQSGEGISHIIMNDLLILNKYFNKHQVMKKNISKWLNLKYGKDVIRSLCLLPWPKFTGFYDPHGVQPFLKSVFEEIWSLEEDILNKTLEHKFRNTENVNQYLFRYWQLASGQFYPINIHQHTKAIHLTLKNVDEAIQTITHSLYKVVCINDTDAIDVDFENIKQRVNAALHQKFSQPSTFEIEE